MAPGHYFDAVPTAASEPSEVLLALPELTLRLATDRGVFAARAADPGTVALLRAGWHDLPRPPKGGHLLDLGCGYGAIACVLAHRWPDTTVWALDVNERARSLAAANAGALGYSNVRVAAPGEVPEGLRFAAIWSNPPIRIGKEAVHDLLGAWLARLEPPQGHACLVVHHHLGGDSLAAWLRSQGYGVTRRASKRGYRILGVTMAVPDEQS